MIKYTMIKSADWSWGFPQQVSTRWLLRIQTLKKKYKLCREAMAHIRPTKRRSQALHLSAPSQLIVSWDTDTITDTLSSLNNKTILIYTLGSALGQLVKVLFCTGKALPLPSTMGSKGITYWNIRWPPITSMEIFQHSISLTLNKMLKKICL